MAGADLPTLAPADSPTNKRPLITDNVKKHDADRIPVTLLSGFLGSGKTTLLQHILKNKDHALRVAVIVNDMGELNIDANLVASAGVLQREEQLVRLENGCICCTLRVDLLEQIARIAQQGEVDYIVIESSGISEPMQVAETFVFELPEGAEEMTVDPVMSPSNSKRSRTDSGASSGDETSAISSPSSPSVSSGIRTVQLNELLVRDGKKLPLLRDIALLDTCVTVVDAATFFHVFDDPRMLADVEENRKQLPEGDTRTITDLLIDQIEFADIILVNKTDLVSAKDIEAIEKVLRRLNSYAKIERTVKGRVDPRTILGTQMFSFERASNQTGWLESLTLPHTPETVEYGIGSFLYKADRPFHPARLTGILQDEFVIVESPTLPPFPSDEDDGHNHEQEDEEEAEEEEAADEEMEPEEDGEPLGKEEIAKRLKSKQNGLFKNLLRSKGVFWLGTRSHNYATWSQAGLYCTLANGGMWIAALPEEERTRTMKELPNYSELMAREHGDRGQELVFIGRFSQEDDEIATIRAALDSCLLTDEEMKQYIAGDIEEWEDPFEPWEYYTFEDEALENKVVG